MESSVVDIITAVDITEATIITVEVIMEADTTSPITATITVDTGAVIMAIMEAMDITEVTVGTDIEDNYLTYWSYSGWQTFGGIVFEVKPSFQYPFGRRLKKNIEAIDTINGYWGERRAHWLSFTPILPILMQFPHFLGQKYFYLKKKYKYENSFHFS